MAQGAALSKVSDVSIVVSGGALRRALPLVWRRGLVSGAAAAARSREALAGLSAVVRNWRQPLKPRCVTARTRLWYCDKRISKPARGLWELLGPFRGLVRELYFFASDTSSSKVHVEGLAQLIAHAAVLLDDIKRP